MECRELGDYKVEFSAKDYAGKLVSDTYIFNVVDSVAPVVKLKQNYNENTVVKVKAGTKFKFGFTVTDDLTPSDKIVSRVILTHLDEYINYIYSDSQFFLYKKGDYIVTLVCQDEAGNATMVKFKLLAE